MFVDLTPEQRALRLKVRDYFQNLMTPELRQQMRGTEGGELFRRTIAQIGRDGWLAVGWPKAYGGQGYAATDILRRGQYCRCAAAVRDHQHGRTGLDGPWLGAAEREVSARYRRR